MALFSKKDVKGFFTVTLPTFFVMLVIVEIILWNFFPVEDPFDRYKNSPRLNYEYIESQFPRKVSYEFEVESGIKHMDSLIHFSTNNMGFRGDSLIQPKPASEYRVFVIGGSTTENLFIDDEFGFERQIQNQLKDSTGNRIYKIYNAGKSGDATPDHLAILSNRIVHLQPDLIILFPGINDLNRLAAKYDYLHYPVASAEPRRNWVVDLKFFLSNFQIVRRTINVLNKDEQSSRTSIFLKTNYADKVREVQELPLNPNFPEVDFSIYERNLMSFIGVCRSQNIDLMFLTQTHTWDSKEKDNLDFRHWMVGIGQERYNPKDLAASLNGMNMILKNIAEKEGISLLDLEQAIPKNTEYFFDDCHFNKKGVLTSAEIIAEKIQSQLN